MTGPVQRRFFMAQQAALGTSRMNSYAEAVLDSLH